MQLHLVRHGQTRWNAERRIQGQLDSALDETGRAQARALRPGLAALGIGAIYCSSSGRTRETLELALPSPPAPPRFRDELREIRLGVWQGRLWDEVRRESPGQVESLRAARADFAVEGAESYVELQRRGVEAIERIVAEAAATVVLVVSHGALIKTVLAHYAGHPLATLSELPPLPNCSRSTIETDGARRRVTLVAGENPATGAWGGVREAGRGPGADDATRGSRATPP